MANFYVDHGAYASALGTTPTWGVPQEGDGSAKDAATAASVGSVLFGSVPTSGTISVCGVSISTTGVLSAGSVDAAADALATNINATTTAVGSTVAIGVPQLRNLVFARGPSGGAPAGTCQIMMRVGSTTLNHASNVNVAVAQTLSPAATLTQFVGGTGGCWGWLINPAAIGVSSSIAVAAYGMMVSKPIAWTATPVQLDTTWARTASGTTITLPTGTTFNRPNVGFPLNLLFDSNLQWTGDSGTGVVRVTIKPNNSNFVYFRPENSGGVTTPVSYSAVMLGGLEIAADISTNAATLAFFDAMTGVFSGRNLRFVEAAAPASNSTVHLNLSALQSVRLRNCEVDFSTYPRATLQNGPKITFGGSSGGNFEWIGGRFRVKLTGTPGDTYGLVIPGYGSNLDIRIEDVAFSTDSAYSVKLFTTSLSVANSTTYFVTAKGCSGLALDAAALGIQSSATHNNPARNAAVNFIGAGTGRHQRYEARNGIAEWNPDAVPAYPKLSATQFDGTIYSVRLFWLGTATGSLTNAHTHGYTSSRINRLTDGVRTITQQLAIDTTREIDRKNIALRVTYTGTDNVSRSEWTLFTQDPTTSAAPWTGLGNWANFAARKLELTTQVAVKQFTLIDAEVMLLGPAPGGTGNTDVFVDPEPAIT